jgi:hypothetical protein
VNAVDYHALWKYTLKQYATAYTAIFVAPQLTTIKLLLSHRHLSAQLKLQGYIATLADAVLTDRNLLNHGKVEWFDTNVDETSDPHSSKT